jgi:hypothetical protein
VKDKDYKMLMTQMLTKNPLSRLCKFSHVKANPWFSGFGWENLISLNIEVPYKPKLESRDIDESKFIPYLTQVKTFKEYVPTSKQQPIDSKKQLEYDEWFKNF